MKKGLAVRHVWAGYGSLDPVLKNLTMDLHPGEAVALLGANGSGKTTLIRVMDGLLRTQRGKTFLDGTDLRSLAPRTIARAVALVPQESPPSFAFGVEEVVRMGRFPHVSRWAGMKKPDWDAVNHAMLEADIDHLRKRPLDKLSGGERHRVMMARGLAQEPAYLLLDEPTAHLDLLHQEDLARLIRKLRDRGLGILISTHDLGFVKRVATRALILAKGRILRKLSARGIGRRAVLAAARA